MSNSQLELAIKFEIQDRIKRVLLSAGIDENTCAKLKSDLYNKILLDLLRLQIDVKLHIKQDLR